MSVLVAGRSDARIQAYELIKILHGLNDSLRQSMDSNANRVSLDVVEEKVLSLQNSGHECSAICQWVLQSDESGGDGDSRLRKCCIEQNSESEKRNLQVRLEELDKMLHSFGQSSNLIFGGRGKGSKGLAAEKSEPASSMASLSNLLRLRRDQVLDVDESRPEQQLKLWQNLFVDALPASTGPKSSTQSRSVGALRPRGTGAKEKQRDSSTNKQARMFQAIQNITFEQIRTLIRRTLRLSSRLVSYQMVHDLWMQSGGDELHASVIDLELFVQFVEGEAKEYRRLLAESEEHARQVSIADALNQEENTNLENNVISSPGAESTSVAPPTPATTHVAPVPSPGRRLKPSKSDPQVDLFCKILDQNGDGIITLSELDHIFRVLKQQHAHQNVASAAERLLGRVRKAVDRTDLTLIQWFELAGAGNKSNGQLTLRELNDSVRRLLSAGDQKPFSEEEVMTLFRWMDPHSSGSLSREEVRNAVDGINPNEGEHIEKSKLYATQRLFERLDSVVKKRGWKISDLFVRFDTNGSGTLEIDEVRKGLLSVLEGNVPPREKTSSFPSVVTVPSTLNPEKAKGAFGTPGKRIPPSVTSSFGTPYTPVASKAAVAAEEIEVTEEDIHKLMAFVDDGDGLVTIPHFDALMRKARKTRAEVRLYADGKVSWAHIKSSIENVEGKSHELWLKNLFYTRGNVDDLPDASRILEDETVEACTETAMTVRDLERHFKNVLQRSGDLQSGDCGRIIVCFMRVLLALHNKQSDSSGVIETNPSMTLDQLNEILLQLSGDEVGACGEASEMLLLLATVAVACSRQQENIQALLLRLDSEGLGHVSTEVFGRALRHIFVKDFVGVDADHGSSTTGNQAVVGNEIGQAEAVSDKSRTEKLQKHSKIERAKRAAAERRYFVINSSSGPFANAQRELPGYKPPAHTTTNSTEFNGMKIPDNGEFEGKDPSSAKASLLYSKEREVQMTWCQLFRCMTKLRMTKRDLYDRVDADHGDSITYDELLHGLEGIDLIKQEISTADLHTLVCSVFPSRGIIHEWGVFEKLLSMYTAEIPPHSFAEWAGIVLLASRKEVSKLRATNQKLNDQGLVLNRTNENIKKDLRDLPLVRKELKETQTTLASTKESLANTEEEVLELKKAKEDLEAQVESARNQLERTTAKLAVTEESLLPLRNEKKHALQKYTSQVAQMKEMERRMKENDALVKANVKKMAAMEKENSDREEEFASDQAAIAVIKKERSSLLASNAALEKRVHGLELANKQVVHQLYGQRIAPDAAPMWETKINELKEQVTEMKKTIASADDEKILLEARFSAKAEMKAKKVAEEKMEFLTQIAQLELKIKEKEADRTFLELELKNIPNVQEELNRATIALDKEKESHQMANEALEQARVELKKIKLSGQPELRVDLGSLDRDNEVNHVEVKISHYLMMIRLLT